MSGDDRPCAGGPQIHCHLCSAALPSDATFCLQCGAKVRAVPPAPTATASGRPAPVAHAPTPAAVPNKQRTMIGVAREGLALPPPPKSERPAPSEPAPPPPQASVPVVAPRSHTMMGVAPPVAPSLAAPRPEPSGPPPSDPVARRRRESPPFIGGQRLGAAPPQSFPPAFGAQRTEDEPAVPKKTPIALWIVGGALGLALVGGAAVLAARALGVHAPPPLQAEVRLAEGALRVHASLPGADTRWRLVHRGTEFPVDASGAVDFPLTGLDPDAVGDVDLPVDVRDGAGNRTARSLRIVIGYRVVADLDHLGDDPPRVHLRFRVPTGASLSIAGQPITLSGQLGVAEIPAPAPIAMESTTASRTERFPIEVRTASGVVIRGEYELRVPRPPLRIEAPGPLSLVDASMVTVEGSLPHAARVLVGAQPATLMGDHFRAEVPIAPGANTLTVHAFASGGAPVTATLTVYRSVTPQDYLASGGGDRGLAPLITPPATPVRLRVRGRVINSTQAAGELPTFQLLVADRTCPNQQCLAWVDMAPGSLARVNEIVEVVGETHGTRSYVNQTGQRRSDTVIRALFVIRP